MASNWYFLRASQPNMAATFLLLAAAATPLWRFLFSVQTAPPTRGKRGGVWDSVRSRDKIARVRRAPLPAGPGGFELEVCRDAAGK